MISQYSNPVDIDREFWADLERAHYWLSKKHGAISNRMKVFNGAWEVERHRPPREGEHDTQIMMRTPGSWLRGHTFEVEDRRVTIYRTFYTDRSMTPRQLRDVKSFRKFADEKIKQGYK